MQPIPPWQQQQRPPAPWQQGPRMGGPPGPRMPRMQPPGGGPPPGPRAQVPNRMSNVDPSEIAQLEKELEEEEIDVKKKIEQSEENLQRQHDVTNDSSS